MPSVAKAELDALARPGSDVDVTKRQEGFCEAVVARDEEGSTEIQWVQYSNIGFCAPVADEDCSFKQPMVDPAISRVLAAASRREPRDLIDLRSIENAILFRNALCTAPGKNASSTPRGALNLIVGTRSVLASRSTPPPPCPKDRIP